MRFSAVRLSAPSGCLPPDIDAAYDLAPAVCRGLVCGDAVSGRRLPRSRVVMTTGDSVPPRSPPAITALLIEARHGNRDALDRLMPLVYGELRAIAHRRLRSERDGHTLQTTALVHEAYIKLVGQREVEWQNRAHFFALSARAMRRILVNYAEGRRAAKRGGSGVELPLDDAALIYSDERSEELVALDDALSRLAVFNERGAIVVEYRFFGGLNHDEIAEVLGVSVATVRRAWELARAWLQRELGGRPVERGS